MSEENAKAEEQGITEPEADVTQGSSPEESAEEGVLLSGKVEGEEPGAEGDKPKEEVPEKYDFKTPEGMELPAETAGKYASMAKEIGLTQTNAQKLLELAADHVKQIQEGHQAEWATQQKAWVEGLKSDGEFGGAALKATLVTANKVLSKYGDPSFINDLSTFGFGNHPGLVKLLARLGKVVLEDRTVEGQAPGAQPKDAAHILFPGMR